MKYLIISLVIFFCACRVQTKKSGGLKIIPDVITESLPHDSDDPAIWVNSSDPSRSLILGTDKDSLGGLYAFDLNGKIIKSKTLTPIFRPNNVDIAYNLKFGSGQVDIAVVTERLKEKIRVISLPDMKFIDNGGIPVFEGEPTEDFRAPMGVALYKDEQTGAIYAIVSRKNGPTDGTYLWQYLLKAHKNGIVSGELVRKFGSYSNKAEIEAIAVDQYNKIVYYSDEGHGIRKYHVEPEANNTELSTFGSKDFQEDMEGIAIIDDGKDKGYIVVSDQQLNSFNIYPRTSPAQNQIIKRSSVKLSTFQTDGCEATTKPLGKNFPKGLFVAMSEGGTFHFYDLRKLRPFLK